MRALELLYHLGALDTQFTLTPLGKIMAQFPLDPQVSLHAHPKKSSPTFPPAVLETADRESQVWMRPGGFDNCRDGFW